MPAGPLRIGLMTDADYILTALNNFGPKFAEDEFGVGGTLDALVRQALRKAAK
jgi:hypothetical protein